jgi:hypothetical protein
MSANRSTSLVCAAAAMLGALAGAPARADQNLVANAGFESGDFTGWTLAGDSRDDHSFVSTPAHYPGWNEWLPNGGSAFAALGGTGPDAELSQTFATTPGSTYTFSFQLGSDGEKPDHFEASFGGATVLALTDAPETPGHDLIHGPAAAAYTFYHFTQTATGPTTTIRFTAKNEPGWWALDDVSVTDLPEPSPLVGLGAGAWVVAGCARRRARGARAA